MCGRLSDPTPWRPSPTPHCEAGADDVGSDLAFLIPSPPSRRHHKSGLHERGPSGPQTMLKVVIESVFVADRGGSPGRDHSSDALPAA
jgi:hypothetical protein